MWPSETIEGWAIGGRMIKDRTSRPELSHLEAWCLNSPKRTAEPPPMRAALEAGDQLDKWRGSPPLSQPGLGPVAAGNLEPHGILGQPGWAISSPVQGSSKAPLTWGSSGFFKGVPGLHHGVGDRFVLVLCVVCTLYVARLLQA